jgi:hypothetical protein
MRIVTTVASTLLFTISSAFSFAASQGEQIIRDMESKQVFDSAATKGRMVINDRFGEKISTFNSWSLGTENSLIEFTSVEEFGQKVLRSEDDIYIFYPDAEELVRLSGAALRDGMLGSDVSYEDMTGEKSLLDDYTVTSLSEETLDGEATYKLELEAKGPSIAYQKQTLWISQENSVALQAHKFSLSGKLLKVERILKTEWVGDYEIATHIKVEDKLKSNSFTEFYIDEIDFETDLDLEFFSLDELTW